MQITYKDWRFVWPEGSDVIEVFRPDDEQPFEAEKVSFGYSRNELNKYAADYLKEL